MASAMRRSHSEGIYVAANVSVVVVQTKASAALSDCLGDQVAICQSPLARFIPRQPLTVSKNESAPTAKPA